ncbi:hypothetical protein J2Z21_009268 [Streptomyces griseochromogenes]|uniref:Uncharacterized protein n=1 Tax=Streptomyces griseochromogenes TaxID=68214 RepID=A0A1B1AZS0_9ACTN|nr:hypothetical protein [Streptomyces griseochromogenes]ANP52040.1 hypothetical protein AVL59_22890 [Streptomyces griseochromogenes]MBP2056250.1 hypothetical protein [Streptomyces griseochromogenes]
MNDETIGPAENEAVGGGTGGRRTEPDTIRRLSRVAVFGLVRGMAAATGSALIAGVTWWMRDH